MSISRRSFVKTSLLSGLSIAALPLATFAQKGAPVPSSPAPKGPIGKVTIPDEHFEALAHLTRDNFTKCLNENFVLFQKNGGSMDLRLSAVDNLPFQGVGKVIKNEPGHGEGFSLIFTSPTRFTQDVYSLGHAWTGFFALVIVPIGNRDGVFYYEGLINRLF